MIRPVAIGDCTEPCQSWNPAVSDAEAMFRYIDLSAVNRDEKRIEGAEAILCGSAPSRARQIVRSGDVLVSTVRPNLNGVAIVPVQLDGATASTGFTVLRARDDVIDRSYLFQWVKSPRFIDEMVRKATGASYPAVSDRIVRESLIPLPELLEQRRIAAILDKADALRAKRREAIAKLDQLLQSVFLKMFSGSDRWPMVAIGDICEVKGGKRLPKGEDYSDSVTQFRYVRVSDLEMGHVHEENLRYLKPDVQQKIKRYTVSEGDLIISIAGTIGLVAPVETTLDGANLTENAAKIVPKDRGAYVPNYLSFALSMPDAQSQIRSQTGQVTIGKLALFRIEKVEVPLPPVEAQVRFSEIVRRTREQARILRLSASQLDSVFASLQHRAFSGTL